MLVHSLASKYARFVVLVRQMYWTPPPLQTIGPPLLKSDDLFLGNQEILDPPPFKNPGHAPDMFNNYTNIIHNTIHNTNIIHLYTNVYISLSAILGNVGKVSIFGVGLLVCGTCFEGACYYAIMFISQVLNIIYENCHT